ncbi:MAG TPA: NAD(P)/FAD-dependent oxidoreductase [Deinococcales bacterium]|nr:NAD(P)/FAD-dependent oxidoreductase [Deinococcales bacterium]
MAQTDVIIIGAGPAGLFAGFYCGMRDLSMRFIDALPEPGGQLAALYPEKYIYDVAGFPQVRARDLVNNQVKQLAPFNPIYTLCERADRLERNNEGGWSVITDKGRDYRATAVIVAGGIGAFEPRKLPAPGIAEFEGKGVSYAVTDLESYRGKRVLVLGGGDSAVDWVLMLKEVASSVTIVHRRNAFRAHAATTNQMIAAAETGEVQVLTPYELARIEGDERVRRAVVYNNATKAEQTLEIDEVVSMVGYLSKLGPIANWGLDLDGDRIKVDPTMRTNLEGVFAVGDIAVYPGKLKLIITGYGEAATAANHAAVVVDPSQKVDPGHSSDHKGTPGATLEPAVAPVRQA